VARDTIGFNTARHVYTPDVAMRMRAFFDGDDRRHFPAARILERT
jgi:hypothetical protein